MADYNFDPQGGNGDVVGPSSSTDEGVARYNGTGGKTLQGSLITIDDSGHCHINQDSVKYYSGASDDMSIYYDGIKGVIKTDEVAASDLHITTGAAKTAVLDTIVWDDEQVQMGNIATSGWFGGSEYADIVEFRSGIAIEFQNDASNNYLVRFDAQLHHTFKEGEDIEFHLHIANNSGTSGNCVFKFTYEWASVDGTFPSATTVSKTIAIDGSSAKHQMEEIITNIDGSGQGVSSILLCTLERAAADGSDTFGESVYVVGIDFHIPINTQGSRLRTAK